MIPQLFKGDATEIKMKAVMDPVFDLTNTGLDDFYQNGFDCATFLLELYDADRMPFSERINRDAFIQFIKLALTNFPVIGTFESYIFILTSIFGVDSDVTFDVTAPGKLSISVDAYSEVMSDFIGRELTDGVYSYFDMLTSDMDELQFRGISGIQTQYELQLLFSEIMPAGIIPTITLNFQVEYFWLAQDGGPVDMLDSFGNDFIFIELGG